MASEPSFSIPRIDTLPDSGHAEEILGRLERHGSRITIDCLNWGKDFPYKPLAIVTAAHDGKNLWLDFLTRCNYLRAENYTDLSPVSEDSCVEVFLQPAEGGEYWNFEFNCIGTANVSHRLTRPEPVRLTSAELARIERYPSCGTRPFCELEGLFTWNLTVKIPLDLMGIDATAGPVHLKGNFYKCASRCTLPHYLSWAPIAAPRPDFHRPEFFGNIVLE